MNAPILVGISGKIGSGKTTLALALQALNSGRTVVCNFADALKREAAERYQVSLDRFYSQDEKNQPISADSELTVGGALQQHGAERRAENENYWLEQLDGFITSLPADVTLVVVGDVRHVNEAEWITQRGGFLVRLNGDPGGVRAASTRNLAHVSETALDDYDDFDLVFNTNNTEPEGMAAAILAWTRPEHD